MTRLILSLALTVALDLLQALIVKSGMLLQLAVKMEMVLAGCAKLEMWLGGIVQTAVVLPESIMNRYLMQLADGQKWYIMAGKGVRSWVKRLASIMELKTCQANPYSRLIFIKKRSDKEWCKVLIKSGWRHHNLGALQFWFHWNVPDVICEIVDEKDHILDIIKMWQALYPIYQRAQDSGGLPIHAALVKWNNKGVLLSASGNTGKSTCCRRLPHSWQVLCDDETLVVRNSQKKYVAHPFPTWSDYLRRNCEKTLNVQQYMPISAIFFLEQANIDEIVPLSQGKAAIFINKFATQICHRYWRNLDYEEEITFKKKLFNNACELAKTVPAFMLRVSLFGKFWNEIEKILKCT